MTKIETIRAALVWCGITCPPDRVEARKIISEAPAALAEVEREQQEHATSFDIRWKADMRAIKRWQWATGRTTVWPDHADLCVWLMNQWDAAEVRRAQEQERNESVAIVDGEEFAKLDAHLTAATALISEAAEELRRRPICDCQGCYISGAISVKLAAFGKSVTDDRFDPTKPHQFQAVGDEFPNTCVHCACFRESVNHLLERQQRSGEFGDWKCSKCGTMNASVWEVCSACSCGESKPSSVRCPKCGGLGHVDQGAFRSDVGDVKCPECKGTGWLDAVSVDEPEPPRQVGPGECTGPL